MSGDEFDYAAERLLDGAPGGPPALSRLLAAASAPGRAAELAGEEAAMAAFRVVRSAIPQTVSVRKIAHHERPRVWPKRASLRLLVVGGALTAVAAAGGVAVAAGVVPPEVVPGPLRNLMPIAPADSPTGRNPGRSAGGSSGTANGRSATEPGRDGPTGSGTPSPSPANLNGLCHSFQDAAAVNQPAAVADPRFAVLVTLAGGPDKVASYCVKIIDDKNGKPTPTPTPAGAAHAGGQ
jgi:hypothetical protein